LSEEKKKLCPVLSVFRAKETSCFEDKCAWWMEEWDICAISSIAWDLDHLRRRDS